ncbi:MAG: hypothetical protein GDA55_00425 [Cellvibrionales bacterium]|nr:hypothetical protein [Cellvibrionales bacterium]
MNTSLPHSARSTPQYRTPPPRKATVRAEVIEGTVEGTIEQNYLQANFPLNLEDGQRCLLVQGDATDRATFSKPFADLIVTSPPYNVGKAYTGEAQDDERAYKDYGAILDNYLILSLTHCDN